MRYIAIFIYIFSLLCFTSNVFSKKLINGNIFSCNCNNFFSILVDKSSKKLYIFQTNNSQPKLIKYFNILIGENNGDKQKIGDKKTPEGIYFIKGFIPPEKLSKIYGAGAFILNYPNIVDRAFKKTGYGIWIHGLDEHSNKKFTKGCVAMHNINLKTLSKYVELGTPVIISNKLIFLTKKKYEEEKLHLLNFLNAFIKTWESGDFESFKNLINKHYTNQLKINYNKFLNIKKRLFEKIKYRKILTDKIKIYKENNTEVLFDYEQFYCATNISTLGRKKLYFYNNKLIAEEYQPTNKNNFIKTKIKNFIKKWLASWETKNIKEYKQYYSHKFKNFDLWIKNKKKKFKKYKKISIRTYNLEFKEISPTKYIVKFKQVFKSDKYHDTGIKKLILTGCPGDFTIESELWYKLK